MKAKGKNYHQSTMTQKSYNNANTSTEEYSLILKTKATEKTC